MTRVKSILKVLWETWNEVKPNRMAASLAYFGMFSFVPLLYVGLTVAGLVVNHQAVLNEVISRIATVLGPEATALVLERLSNAAKQQEGSSLLATMVGLGAMLYVASGLFATLEDMLNTIWRNPFPSDRRVLAVVRQQFIACVMVLAVGLSFVIMTALTFGISLLGSMTESNSVSMLINLIVSFLLTTVAFALLYRVLARVKPSWGAIWSGAFAAALLWTVGKSVFGLYLQISTIRSPFDAASALVVLLLGIYYGALMFLLGAMLTRAVDVVWTKE